MEKVRLEQTSDRTDLFKTDFGCSPEILKDTVSQAKANGGLSVSGGSAGWDPTTPFSKVNRWAKASAVITTGLSGESVRCHKTKGIAKMQIATVIFDYHSNLHKAIVATLSRCRDTTRLFDANRLDLDDLNILRRSAVVNTEDAFTTAEDFLKDLQGDFSVCPLVSSPDEDKFEIFHNGPYVSLSKKRLKSLVEAWCRMPGVWEREGEVDLQGPVQPKANFTKEVIEQIGLLTAFEQSDELGQEWREQQDGDPDVNDLIVVANGIIDTRDFRLLEPTPRLYTASASDVKYDPAAGEPTETLKFLNTIFDGDQEQIDTLFEGFGETLAGTNYTQKALLLKGETRSGKSTCVKVLKALLPKNKYASKRVGQLPEKFGMQSLVGKQLCAFEDVRNVPKKGMECLLSLIGADDASVEIKYNADFVGKLQLKCFMATNVRINASTDADAFRARLVTLETVGSFKGREDTGLLDRLLKERTEILLKAVQGYHRLRERGNYKQPAKSNSVLDEICQADSEIDEFIEDCIEEGEGYIEDRTSINEAYQLWAENQGYGSKKAGDVWAGITERCPRSKANKQTRVQDPVQTNVRVRSFGGVRLNASTLNQLAPNRQYRYAYAEDSTAQLTRVRLGNEVTTE